MGSVNYYSPSFKGGVTKTPTEFQHKRIFSQHKVFPNQKYGVSVGVYIFCSHSPLFCPAVDSLNAP